MIASGLCLVSLGGQLGRYKLGLEGSALLRVIDVKRENNIPTWYAASALLLCSVVALAVAWAEGRNRRRWVPHWVGLGLVLLLLAVDEVGQFHERWGTPWGRAVLKAVGVDRGGFLARAWVVFGAAVVLGMVLVYWPFLAGLPARTRRLFVAAGGLYVGGAVVMETIYAQAEDRYGRLSTPREQDVLTTIEEFSEMTGVVVLAYALISPHGHLPAQL